MPLIWGPGPVTLTPLDAAGRPAGPPVTYPFPITTTERTTAMPKKSTATRPTVAERRQLQAELDACARDLQTALQTIDELRREQRATEDRADRSAEERRQALQVLDGLDPEGRAVADCVLALDRMLAPRAMGESNDGASWGRQRVVYPQRTADPLPAALSDPVGRVLTHLAARYQVALVPAPQPEQTEADRNATTLFAMPKHVADQLQRLADSGALG